MGREGAINQILDKIGIPGRRSSSLGFSELSVTLAMIQLYILFMVTPLFFTLAQVDRTALEAARDLGGNWFQTFREVILPQTMPGIVIGVDLHLRAHDGRVRHRARRSAATRSRRSGRSSQSKVELAVQYPQGAASAVLLVLALDRSACSCITAVLEPARGALTCRRRIDWSKWGLGAYFVLFLALPLRADDPDGDPLAPGRRSARSPGPFQGPISFDWWQSLFDANIPGSHADEIRAAGEVSL